MLHIPELPHLASPVPKMPPLVSSSAAGLPFGKANWLLNIN